MVSRRAAAAVGVWAVLHSRASADNSVLDGTITGCHQEGAKWSLGDVPTSTVPEGAYLHKATDCANSCKLNPTCPERSEGSHVPASLEPRSSLRLVDPGPAEVMAEGTAFCTGHTFFPWNEVCCYTDLIKSEFRDEYKMAHGMFVPKGPGRAKMYDWSEKRRDPIPLPVTGCAAAKPYHGGRPPRKGHSSSSAVGGWWNDPLFQELHKKKGQPLPELPSIGLGKSTASDIGNFWHNKDMFEADLNNPALRSKNGIKRLIPVELRSQFALEDLSISDRML